MSDHRLPTSVQPSHYRIHLAPDLDAATFRGDVTISAHASEPVRELVLNAIELEVDNVQVNGHSTSFTLDDDTERLTIRLPDEQSGNLTIEVTFAGVLNDKLHGFYRSTFADEHDENHTIATTQFQSTDARRCFPCVDEPAFKAAFGVSLTVDDSLTAISNSAEIARTQNGDGTRTVTFADTMVMSTYLVAFVVGPLEVTNAVDVDGVPVRIVHVPGKGELTAFALETAAAALRYFTSYYEIAYPGDKLDLLAIPDFAFGAMENLGCVTFREVLLLVDPDTASQPELQNVADVINHELAHMWFGDLVTMGWWNGIWLNEAFATFMEMKATDAFRPAWDRWTSFGISRSAAFDTDSLLATRPIEFDVVSPSDAEAMFDILTYEKGAAVVRMLEQFVGEDTFRDGIRLYLTRHAYGNTETHELWDAIEEVSGAAVRTMMDSWIFQGGYPLIDLSVEGEIRQRRFTYSDAGVDSTWSIPVFVRNEAGVAVHELATDVQPFDTAGVRSANASGNGFYRVRLPDAVLRQLSTEGPGDQSAVERYGVIDDAWALTLAGHLTLSQFVALLEGFSEDRDLSVWQRMLGSSAAIRHALAGQDRVAFERWLRSHLLPIYSEVGWESSAGESDRQRQLRGAVVTAMGTDAAFDLAVAEARNRLGSTGDPAVLAASVQIVAANGTAADFTQFRQRMHDAPTPQDERRYLYALTEFPGRSEIEALCAAVLTDEIRSQDGPYVLGRSLTNDAHGPMVWEFIKANWDTISDRFPSNSIARMLDGVKSLSDNQTAADVVQFLGDHPVPQGGKTIAQHLERLETNRLFRNRAAAEFQDHAR